MRKAFIAEELLSLTTTRERAHSIAGDLAEEAGAHGLTWYCGALASVSLALFFAAFGAARVHTLRLLAGGLVVWSLLYAVVRVLGAVTGLQPVDAGGGASYADLAPTVQIYLAAALMLSGVLTGVVLGRWTTANGMNAVAPLAMFWALAAIVAPFMDVVMGTATWYCTALYLTGLPICYLVPLLGGGAFAGRRALPVDSGARG